MAERGDGGSAVPIGLMACGGRDSQGPGDRVNSVLEFAEGGALHLAVVIAFPEVVAAVVVLFAVADGEGDFDFAVFPVEGKGDEGIAFRGGGFGELADLGFMQEQLAGGGDVMVLAVAVGVFVDAGAIEPDGFFFHLGEGIGDLAFAGAEGFHLGAVQHNARLVGVEDGIIPAGFVVGDDVGHGGRITANRRKFTRILQLPGLPPPSRARTPWDIQCAMVGPCPATLPT